MEQNSKVELKEIIMTLLIWILSTLRFVIDNYHHFSLLSMELISILIRYDLKIFPKPFLNVRTINRENSHGICNKIYDKSLQKLIVCLAQYILAALLLAYWKSWNGFKLNSKLSFAINYAIWITSQKNESAVQQDNQSLTFLML